jgi:hypothetical protein
MKRNHRNLRFTRRSTPPPMGRATRRERR